MKTVRDVMQVDIEILRTSDSVADTAAYLASHDEESVPFCLVDGVLAGSVTAQDIVAQVVAKGLDARHVPLGDLAVAQEPEALDIDVPVEEAVAVMARAGQDRMPVTERARVVGFVTRSDVARSLTFRPWVVEV